MTQSLSRQAMVAILVLGLAGCASNVAVDYNRQVPFGAYSSYALAPEQAEQVQSLDDSRVRDAVGNAMADEGYEEVAAGQADLWVRFRFEDETKYEATGFSYGLGLFNRPFGFGLSTRPEARPVPQEKLVLELIDSDTKRVVWQGTSREYLTDTMGSQYRAGLIGELVENMFKRYPPGEGE